MLNETNTPRVFATTELERYYPPAAPYAGMAAGMLVIPISRAPADYLLFFRREMVHTVSWGGNPDKTPEPGTTRLSPRRSFAIWRQTMRGQCSPWLDAELRVAESLRISLPEVMVRRLSRAAAERTLEASKQQELLIAELNHRVRNILALIRALVSRSRESAGSLENFVAGLDGRIQSLAQAHDQLTDDRWGPVPLRVMIENEFQAYLCDGEPARAQLFGPPVLVEPQALTVLALVIHEMATNSVKYGALSGNSGSVYVRWRLDAAGALVIEWRETGGPAVVPPSRRGFGSTVIERTVPFELQGSATVRYEPVGLEADFTVPERFVRRGVDMAPRPPTVSAPAPTIRAGGLPMVLEDSALLAMDAEEILLGLGFNAVEVAGTSADALEALTRIDGQLAFALLDINLGDHTSMPVARELLRRGIPFAFATGDGKNADLSPEMAAAAPVIPKPYRPQDIAALVGRTRDPRGGTAATPSNIQSWVSLACGRSWPEAVGPILDLKMEEAAVR